MDPRKITRSSGTWEQCSEIVENTNVRKPERGRRNGGSERVWERPYYSLVSLPTHRPSAEQLCVVGEDGVAEVLAPTLGTSPAALMFSRRRESALWLHRRRESWAASSLTDSKTQCLSIALNQWIWRWFFMRLTDNFDRAARRSCIFIC